MILPSRKTVEGASRAPHRAMYKSMGLSDDDLGRPLVAVCSTCNDATPCNIHLGRLAQKSKEGVKDSGNILPGHGGILDRFDGLLISIPFVFFYLVLEGKF